MNISRIVRKSGFPALALGSLLSVATPSTAQEIDAEIGDIETEKPETPDLSRPVQPENQIVWVRRTMRDYPAEAIRQNLAGRVAFELTIDANGNVTDCDVVGSSGHRILDRAACRSMSRYARFQPALDENGNPVSATWGTSIVYGR
ncbi:energy transducer TonB [Aurantiacibacter sediminis]|uniref:Energy transducer TonB n=1 Tax=Aurantiacibacter sediminis TaxID=2793064 RepID=A0ABS0N5Q7_9SPHN|nr:energy transducer TonB [Aurantiacibacter sediminis]MBH5323105.1 energy transducer TonB [Aurantiacibacter sediminis]